MPSYTLGPLPVEAVCWDGSEESCTAIQALAGTIDAVCYQGRLCPRLPPQWGLHLPPRLLLPSERGAMVIKFPWGILVIPLQDAPALLPVVQGEETSAYTDAHTSYAEQPCTIGCFLATRTVWP